MDSEHEEEQEERPTDEENARVIEILTDENMSDADKIKALYKEGYKQHQIVRDFGFSESTVYQTVPVNKKKAKKGKNTNNTTNHSGFDGYPVSRKVAGGGEMMNPETLIRMMEQGGWGTNSERMQGMLEMRAAMLMLRDMLDMDLTKAKTEETRANYLVKLLKETREESKQSNEDLAKQTVVQVANTLEEIVNRPRPGEESKEKQKESKPSSLEGRMDKYLGMMFDMMEGMFMPGAGPGGQLEGWEYEDQRGSTPPSSGGAPDTQQEKQGPPPGWETETIKEEDDGNESGDVRDEPATDGPGAGGGQSPEDGGQEIPPDGEA